MTTAFQPTSTAQTCLVTAAAIIKASELPFAEDYDAAVEIVARALGKLDADELESFSAQNTNAASATVIVYAALEVEASSDDDHPTVEASVSKSATTLPPTNSVATEPNPTASPMAAMLGMIREIILPVAEHMTAQEAMIIEISARLSRLETENSRH